MITFITIDIGYSSEVKLLSCVWLFATPWTVAYWAPPSWDFPGESTRVDAIAFSKL